VAGRLSRFDGGRQGFGAWLFGLLITIVLAVAGAVFGSKYNVLGQLQLPRIPVDEGSLAKGGLRRDRLITQVNGESGITVAEPIPAGSDVSAGTYRYTNCGNELEVQSTQSLPPCSNCNNGEWRVWSAAATAPATRRTRSRAARPGAQPHLGG
jgi:hypothetical protein